MGWGDLFSAIFKIVTMALGTYVTALATAAVNAFLKKHHLSIAQGLADKLIREVNVQVLAEENKAADVIKNKGNAITGAEKFANVLNAVMAKYKDVPEGDIKNLINATVISIDGIGPKDLVPRKEAQNGNAGKPGGPAGEGAPAGTKQSGLADKTGGGRGQLDAADLVEEERTGGEPLSKLIHPAFLIGIGLALCGSVMACVPIGMH